MVPCTGVHGRRSRAWGQRSRGCWRAAGRGGLSRERGAGRGPPRWRRSGRAREPTRRWRRSWRGTRRGGSGGSATPSRSGGEGCGPPGKSCACDRPRRPRGPPRRWLGCGSSGWRAAWRRPCTSARLRTRWRRVRARRGGASWPRPTGTGSCPPSWARAPSPWPGSWPSRRSSARAWPTRSSRGPSGSATAPAFPRSGRERGRPASRSCRRPAPASASPAASSTPTWP